MTVAVRSINIYQAKTHLSKLVDQAAAGEDVLISRAGKPVARLRALREAKRPVRWLLKGRVKLSRDFDAPLPQDLQAQFAGRA